MHTFAHGSSGTMLQLHRVTFNFREQEADIFWQLLQYTMVCITRSGSSTEEHFLLLFTV